MLFVGGPLNGKNCDSIFDDETFTWEECLVGKDGINCREYVYERKTLSMLGKWIGVYKLKGLTPEEAIQHILGLQGWK